MATKKQEPAPLPAQLWDMDRLMQFFGVSRPQIYKLMEKQGLPSLKLSGAVRFDPRKIDAWLEEQQQHSA